MDPALTLIEFLPIFEDTDFVPAEWPDRGAKELESGVTASVMPYPDYHPAIEKFRLQAHSFTAGINPFEPLAGDDLSPSAKFNAWEIKFTPEYFETATRDQIRRFFSLMHQGERFSDGHIESQFLNGNVVAALKRLKELL